MTTLFDKVSVNGVWRQIMHVKNNYFSELALGSIYNHSAVNKFGASPSGIQITATDIWSRADATPTQQIWLAPTAQRVHTIASSSASDDGAVIRVWGLSTWSSAETSQDITLPNGTTSGEVIIHRMRLLQTAAHPTLVGTVTATAATDTTITAVILPSDGQTQMAIYGVPSGVTALLHKWSASINKAQATAASCDFEIRVNERPDLQTTGFLRKWNASVQSTGNNRFSETFNAPLVFTGPCIIKIQATASAADIDGEASFSLELVTT